MTAKIKLENVTYTYGKGYTCPARVPIVQHIRNKKAQLQIKRKKAAASAAEKM